MSFDGTASQVVTVTINGTNDIPVISGVSTDAVTEDVALTSGNLTAGATLTIADVDAGESSFAAQATTAGSNGFGTFTLTTAGVWTYTADNTQTAIQELGSTDFLTDSFTAVSFDGTASQVVTVTINGTNDIPVISGVSTDAVTEDVALTSGNLTAGATLTIADVDAGESSFQAQASTAGSNGLGTFTLTTAGVWTYTADNAQTAIQELGSTDFLTDSFTALSFDGTSQLVTVTINGTNDAPTITAPASASVTEDVTTAITGIQIADVDAGSGDVTVTLEVTLGTLSVLAGVTGGLNSTQIVPSNGNRTVTLTGTVAAINVTLAAVSGLLYTTDLNSSVNDTLDITVNDGVAADVTDSFTITVTTDGNASTTNVAPVAIDDPNVITNVTTGTFVIEAEALLANDFDVEGDILSIDSVTDGTTVASLSTGDALVTSPGTDGSTGNFTYVASDGTATSGSATVTVTVDTVGNITGTTGNDILIGGSAADTLDGDAGDDFLYGNGGADTLNGGTGDDVLNGGAGADILVGGQGIDTLTGGADNDTFTFQGGDVLETQGTLARVQSLGTDTITDFLAGDLFALSNADFGLAAR